MFSLNLTGLGAVEAKMTALFNGMQQEVRAALQSEMEIELVEAQRRTPVDTGALRASGRVENTMNRGNELGVKITFGGADVPYAVEVHENLEMFHRVGEAKFLESTLRESAPYMAERLARRIDLERAARG